RRVRVHQDPLTGERALAANADRVGIDIAGRVTWHDLGPSLVEGASTVLLQLPRGLDALDEIASVVARHADPSVRLVAGGRVKHRTLSMNDVLARHFGDVRASRGVQKSRVLHAGAPRADGGSAWPVSQRHDDVGLTLCAHGAAFAGASLDIGTRFLLAQRHEIPAVAHAIDLGCGTGAIAAAYALAHPESRVIASDRSAAAVASA